VSSALTRTMKNQGRLGLSSIGGRRGRRRRLFLRTRRNLLCQG
jgi:hypothetical protein